MPTIETVELPGATLELLKIKLGPTGAPVQLEATAGALSVDGDGVLTTGLFLPRLAGFYYSPSLGGTRSTDVLLADTSRAVEFRVERTSTFNKIGVSVTGAVGATVRLAIYADSGFGRPGALVVEAGPLDASTTGVKEATINATLQPGLYWLAVAARGGAPTIQVLTGTASTIVPQSYSGLNQNGYVGANALDAMANPFAHNTRTPNAPLILVWLDS